MSLQFIVAVVLLEGAALLEQFSEEKIADPRVWIWPGGWSSSSIPTSIGFIRRDTRTGWRWS